MRPAIVMASRCVCVCVNVCVARDSGIKIFVTSLALTGNFPFHFFFSNCHYEGPQLLLDIGDV